MPAGKSAGKNMSARSVASLSGTTEEPLELQIAPLVGAHWRRLRRAVSASRRFRI